MPNDAKRLATAVASSFEDAPKLHELDDGGTIRVKLGYAKGRVLEGVTIGFHFSQHTTKTHEQIEEAVESRLDKRKFKTGSGPHGRSWTLGYVEIDGDGDVVDHEIKEEYLKPTEKNHA